MEIIDLSRNNQVFKFMPKRRKKNIARHGGAREGAGRPFRPLTLLKNTPLGEKIIVKRLSHGQYRRHATTRIELIVDKIFNEAAQGDLKAIRLYLNLVLGSPAFESQEEVEEDSQFVISKEWQETVQKVIGKVYSTDQSFGEKLDEKLKKFSLK